MDSLRASLRVCRFPSRRTLLGRRPSTARAGKRLCTTSLRAGIHRRPAAQWTHSIGTGQNRQAATMHTHSSMAPVKDHEPRKLKRQEPRALALSSKWWSIDRTSRSGRRENDRRELQGIRRPHTSGAARSRVLDRAGSAHIRP